LKLIAERLSPVLKRLSARGLGLLSALHRVGMDQDIRWTRQFAARMVRVLVLAGMSARVNQIPVRASALTYTTILSFVPIAVILSAVAGHFGYLDLLSHLVYSMADSMNLDIDLDPILGLIDTAQKVDFHRLGLVGSLGLLFTFFLSMSNIELAMDQIWDIRKERNWWQRIKEFTPFLILLIVLVMGVGNLMLKYRTILENKFTGASVPGFVHSTIVVLISTLSVVGFIWLGLVMIFYLIPNTKVRFFPAVLAASLSTSAIYALSRALIHFPSLFMSKNNFIYGSLAVLPVILGMIYLLWLIVLFGASVGFVYQRLYHSRDKTSELGPAEFSAFHRMEKEVLEVLRTIHVLSGSKRLNGKRLVSLEVLTSELWDDAKSIEALAAPLVDLGLLGMRRIRTGPVYAPRKPLAEVDLTALHNLLLQLDPKGTGKLRPLTALDELKHTLGILYSSGKRNPPLYMSTVLPEREAPNP
jgi:YihY family inner membrane protein